MGSKRVAVFYPKTVRAGWSITSGLAPTLRRMGYEVTDVGTPMAPASDTVPPQLIDHLKRTFPTLEELKKHDAIIVSGPEHIAPWLDAVYESLIWKQLDVPKASMYHESSSRADGGEYRFDLVLWTADHHFYPAIQDAEVYDQEQFAEGRAHWEPFAVDTEMFKPDEMPENDMAPLNLKDIPIGFIGSIYDLRASFLNALGKFEHPPIRIGQVAYQDIDGVNIQRSMEMMAGDIRRMKVFFNLPALSLLNVGKIVEIMACGTMCLTPQLPTKCGAHRNMTQFTSGEHLVYYRSGNVAQTAETLKYWTREEHAEERERIALAGMKLVHEKYAMTDQLARVLSKLGIKRGIETKEDCETNEKWLIKMGKISV